jgi:hypothetical protein
MATAKNILIFLLIFVIGFFVLGDSKYIKDDTTIITKIDTLIKDTTIYKYKKGKDIPFVVLDTIYQIDEVHDTIKIISDYSRTYAYYDTLKIDSAQYVYVSDTISQNKILGRGYGGHFVQKTITITNDIYHKPKPKNELYLGLMGDYRRFDEKLGVGVGVIYKKQKEAYSFNYTTNQISIGLYKKLF